MSTTRRTRQSFAARFGATAAQIQVLAKLKAGRTAGGMALVACEQRGWVDRPRDEHKQLETLHADRLTPEGETVLARARARGW